MSEIDVTTLQKYREQTYCSSPGLRIHTLKEAQSFVDRRSFVFFWRIKGEDLPSLWTAVAGDRPVPNTHDDPAHITWDWKDSMLGKKRWYYSRLLRRKNTILSLEAAVYFYALTPNYGDYENDYLDLFESGSMTYEARQVYETLLREGPLDSLALRRAAGLWGKENNGRFNRSMDDLQILMMIMPVGIAQAGRWNYAMVYDITARHMPELEQKARFIDMEESRTWLLERYFRSVGASSRRAVTRLFGWKPLDMEMALDKLLSGDVLTGGLQFNGSRDEWLALPELLEKIPAKS